MKYFIHLIFDTITFIVDNKVTDIKNKVNNIVGTNHQTLDEMVEEGVKEF